MELDLATTTQLCFGHAYIAQMSFIQTLISSAVVNVEQSLNGRVFEMFVYNWIILFPYHSLT
jgi:hypothetical protein